MQITQKFFYHMIIFHRTWNFQKLPKEYIIFTHRTTEFIPQSKFCSFFVLFGSVVIHGIDRQEQVRSQPQKRYTINNKQKRAQSYILLGCFVKNMYFCTLNIYRNEANETIVTIKTIVFITIEQIAKYRKIFFG